MIEGNYGNTKTTKDINNIYIGSNVTIPFDTDNKLTENAQMGVQHQNGAGVVTTDYDIAYNYLAAETYFFADSEEYVAVLNNTYGDTNCGEVVLDSRANYCILNVTAGENGSIVPSGRYGK